LFIALGNFPGMKMECPVKIVALSIGISWNVKSNSLPISRFGRELYSET